MKKIDQIKFSTKKISLLSRNLILTGNNGVGKTYFLTNLYEKLQFEFRDKHVENKKNNHKINDALTVFNNEFIAYSDILELDFKYIYQIKKLQSTKNVTEDQKTYALKELYYIYNEHLNTFLKQKNIFKIHKGSNSKNKNKNYYSEKPEHLIKSNDLLKNTLDNLLSTHRLFEISFSDKDTNTSTIFSFFDVNSRLQIPEKILQMGNMYDIKDLSYYLQQLRSNFDSDVEGALERYLLEKREEMRNSEDDISEKYYSIFNDIENDLKLIFDDETTTLSFDDFNNRVLVLQKNESISFGFDELPSGFKSIFKIYSNLLFKSKLINSSKEQLNGIVLIDEIDCHLHISLQKKVLPFFIRAFPNIQFIVSTHSPFVVTSTDNDTVVYDISSGEFFENDLTHYSYESVIKGLFHVNPISLETKKSIESLKILLNQIPVHYDSIRSIIANLIPLDKNDQLDKKVKNLYLQAINLLADNNELEDLDV